MTVTIRNAQWVVAHLARGHHSLAEGLPGLPAVAGAQGVGTEEMRSSSAMLGASAELHSPWFMAQVC